MNRIMISLILLLFSSSLQAQTSVDGFMKLFDWVKKLDENITTVVRKENQKKLVRQIGYLQADLDELIVQKNEVTEAFMTFCEDTLSNTDIIEKEIQNYNKEIPKLIDRFEKIRKEIVFEEDFYLATESRIVTKNDSIKSDSLDIYQFMNVNNPPPELSDYQIDTIEVKIKRNRYKWKEVPSVSHNIDIDVEHIISNTKTSLTNKSLNVEYIKSYSLTAKKITGNCDLDLILNESNRAIDVLTNMRNYVRELKSKIEAFDPVNE